MYLADAVRRARPNPGHDAVAWLEKFVPRVSVLTQNVDNLHQAAGSKEVIELHGNLFRFKPFVDAEAISSRHRRRVICPACGCFTTSDKCYRNAGRENIDRIALKEGPIPRCPGCLALLRPDVVWFGEGLDSDVLENAWSAVETCDVMICIGSSLLVEPAASIPRRAHRRGALVIEINTEPTVLSGLPKVVSLIGTAGEILPRLLGFAWSS